MTFNRCESCKDQPQQNGGSHEVSVECIRHVFDPSATTDSSVILDALITKLTWRASAASFLTGVGTDAVSVLNESSAVC